jgi:hypothetical protein
MVRCIGSCWPRWSFAEKVSAAPWAAMSSSRQPTAGTGRWTCSKERGYSVHLANPHANDWGHRRVKNDERDAGPGRPVALGPTGRGLDRTAQGQRAPRDGALPAQALAAWASLVLFVDLNDGIWDPDPPNVDEAETAMLSVAAHEVDESGSPRGSATECASTSPPARQTSETGPELRGDRARSPKGFRAICAPKSVG